MGTVTPGFSLLVPVRDGAAGLERLRGELSIVLGGPSGRFGPGELVLVDDGSVDGTWETILRMARGGTEGLLPARGVRLGRGRGQQAALLAGLARCRDRPVVTMDDDSAHPPESVPDLLETLENGADAAYALPPARPGRGLRKAASRLHQFHLSLLTGSSPRIRVGSFRALSPNLVDRILGAPAPYPYLSAQILALRPRPAVAMVPGGPWREGGNGRFRAAALLRTEWALERHYGPAARMIRSLSGRRQAPRAAGTDPGAGGKIPAGVLASGWIAEETHR